MSPICFFNFIFCAITLSKKLFGSKTTFHGLCWLEYFCRCRCLCLMLVLGRLVIFSRSILSNKSSSFSSSTFCMFIKSCSVILKKLFISCIYIPLRTAHLVFIQSLNILFWEKSLIEHKVVISLSLNHCKSWQAGSNCLILVLKYTSINNPSFPEVWNGIKSFKLMHVNFLQDYWPLYKEETAMEH